MKKAALVIFSLIASALFANAQEMTKQAKIERILALTKADAMMDQMFNQLKSMMMSPTGSGEPGPTAELQGKVMDLVKQKMSWDKLRPQYVKLYDETYSAEEIDGILAFYQSPAGRAMLDKMPVILSKSIAIAQGMMGDIVPDIQRILREGH